MNTQWLPIPGFEGHYEASSDGEIRSCARQIPTKFGPRNISARILRPKVKSSGHLEVTLQMGGYKKHMPVHTAVLLTFVGPRPDGLVCCHNNGDPLDNRVENLRWDTPAANSQDAIAHGTNFHASKTHCKRGHLFDEANTYYSKEGSRYCRACKNAAGRAWRAGMTPATGRLADQGFATSERGAA